YYPAAAAVLKVRWEDFARDKLFTSGQLADPFAPFSVVDAGRGAAATDSATFEFLQPRRFVIENNGIRTADTITRLEFDGAAFPFDPRLQRSTEIAVSIGQREDARAPYRFSDTDKVFVGFADNFERSLDSTGDKVVLDGRDFTGLLLDAPYPDTAVKAAEDVADAVRSIVAKLPAARNLVVVSLVDEFDTRTYASYGSRPAPKPGEQRGRRPRTQHVKNPFGKLMSKPMKAKGRPVAVASNFWDVVQDLCDSLGLIAFIQREELVIAPPRTLSDPAYAGKAPRLIWGRNIEKLTIRKRLGHMRAPNVQVVSHVPGKAKPLKAQWPNPPIPYQIDIDPESGEKRPHIRQERYYVSGVANEKTLRDVAQRIYEEKAQNEIELQVQTKEMTATSIASEIVDLTQIRDGDPVSIELDSVLDHEMETLTVPQRVDVLVRKGYRPGVAQSLAEHWDDLQSFSNVFRVKTARHEWDHEAGYSLALEAVNYLSVGGLPDGTPAR
ncbi:MAG TPA: hypothetical protein VGH20_10455, partial [Myxococcales bacterium]